MGLHSLFVIVFLQRREVLDQKLPLSGGKLHCHCGPEHGQPLTQRDDILFVQPHERAIHQPCHFLDLCAQKRIARQAGKQVTQCGFDLQVFATLAFLKSAQKMSDQRFPRLLAQSGGLLDHPP